MTKILLMSDTHCGHLMGITPPEFQTNRKQIKSIMSPLWDWWMATKAKRYDIVFHLGDAVEGEDVKDAGFLLTGDIQEQIDMAVHVVKSVKADQVVMVNGTPYHSGSGNLDYEPMIAKECGDNNISWMRKVEVEGIKFNLQHTVGKTSTPVGGDIMLRKQIIWNRLYAEMEQSQRADWILRGHVHELRSVTDAQMTCLSLPALKIGNADYDRYPRRMSGGFYNVGFCEMTIEKGRVIEFTPHLYQVKIKSNYEVLK